MSDLSHADLVRVACRWLAKTKRCPLVFAEAGKNVGVEEPDALGFAGLGTLAYVVECKVSRADFLADGKKRHRATGMGSHRWFLAPMGLIATDEIPAGWGLLVVTDGAVHEILAAPRRFEGRDLMAEQNWLYCTTLRHQKRIEWRPREHRFVPQKPRASKVGAETDVEGMARMVEGER
jgi:hypothetical protein